MLMITIIDELSQQLQNPTTPDCRKLLSYFICQGTDSRLNNATAILRGLIYLLVIQEPLLLWHLRQQYDYAGGKLFEHPDLFYALSEVFQNMLRDPNFPGAHFIVDALDECSTELLPFLDLVRDTMATRPSQVKWIISSRNWDDIEQRLQLCDSHKRLGLELNAEQISNSISIFIIHKASQLVALRHYEGLQQRVTDRINQKADGTFLWVSLILKELENQVLGTDVLEIIEQLPAGLIPLYDGMMERIQQLYHKSAQRCFLALSTAALAFRPLHLLEMHTITGFQSAEVHQAELERIINMCSSFLTVREGFVYFIHQSAKDYLVRNKYDIIFPAGPGQIHHNVFSSSLTSMSKHLRRDIYNLNDASIVGKNLTHNPDPIAHIRYSCVFWFDHLCNVGNQILEHSKDLSDAGNVHTFLQRHFLHWLESLSHMHKIPVGISTIRKLQQRVQVCFLMILNGFKC